MLVQEGLALEVEIAVVAVVVVQRLVVAGFVAPAVVPAAELLVLVVGSVAPAVAPAGRP